MRCSSRWSIRCRHCTSSSWSFCIQQVEGNLIYPHVVGNSVGLPALYVIVAISIGGSLMGIVGMIIFIPICSIFYTLLKTDVNERIARAQKKPESAEAAQ
ncbi:MAG: AI-2E family transporter [Merdibacter sp.]